MLTFHQYGNTDAAIINLLKELGIRVSSKDVSSELEKHPDNPSMLAISDVLDWFQIPNAAYKVETNKITDVPTPFIAYTKRNNDFVTVKKIESNNVILADNKRSNYKLPIDEFKNNFNGVVLVAEVPEQGKFREQPVLDSFGVYKSPVAIVGLTIAFITTLLFRTNYLNNLNWQILTLTLFKSTGLITSVLLLIQSIDKNNPLVQTLCGGGSGKTDCNAILTSKAANVFTGLTWSEVGFFYFAATWLALLFGGQSTAVLNSLTLLNIFSLPYTIYSINYQARVAKQWCVFCLIIQGLLWLEFISFVTLLKQPFLLSATAIVTLLFSAIIPVTIWLLLKPLFLKVQQLTALKSQLQKFKYNRELFETALKEQPKYAIPSDEWSIVLGNVEASHIITMVSNPYCQPCSRAHAQVEEALNNLGNIQVRIVFVGNNIDEKDSKTRVHRHLMKLNALPDKTIIRSALHDWYEQKQKNYDEWVKVYPVPSSANINAQLAQQKKWVDIAEISATPTLLVNGYKLPKNYQLADLKYMLE